MFCMSALFHPLFHNPVQLLFLLYIRVHEFGLCYPYMYPGPQTFRLKYRIPVGSSRIELHDTGLLCTGWRCHHSPQALQKQYRPRCISLVPAALFRNCICVKEWHPCTVRSSKRCPYIGNHPSCRQKPQLPQSSLLHPSKIPPFDTAPPGSQTAPKEKPGLPANTKHRLL